MRRFLVVLLVASAVTLLGVGPAGAIAIEQGPDGDATTVKNPDEANGNAEEGLNPAHGPSCWFFNEDDGCANNNAPADNSGEEARGALADNPPGVNVGAWNSVFVSNENSAICGVWATVEEARIPALACDFVAEP